MSLQLFSFYATCPNIDARHNTIVRDAGPGLTVTPGQYDAVRLAEVLAGLLDVMVSFDDNTLGFTFQSDTSFTLQGSIMPLLGWPSSEEVYTSVDGALKSPGVCNLGGTRFIEVSTSLATDNIVNGDRSGLVLARLPISGSYGELISYSAMDVAATCLERTLSTLTILITDDAGQPISFTGTDWCLSLFFKASPDPLYMDLIEHYSLAQERKNHDASNVSEKSPGGRHADEEERRPAGGNSDQGKPVRDQGP